MGPLNPVPCPELRLLTAAFRACVVCGADLHGRMGDDKVELLTFLALSQIYEQPP